LPGEIGGATIRIWEIWGLFVKFRRVLLPVVTVVATAVVFSPASSAAFELEPPLVSGLAGPLQLAVRAPAAPPAPGSPRRADGLVFVAQQFSGVVSRVRPNGTLRDLVKQRGGVGGVAVRDGRVAFTFTKPATPGKTGLAQLRVRTRSGSIRTVAHLAAFEAKANPDRHRTYGFVDLAPDCASQLPEGMLSPQPYSGEVYANPYALANAPGGGWYVADAGGNDILKVSPRGAIKVVYVARPQRAVVTAEAAEALGLPECAVGATYAFEPVPTDVEVGRRGRLFVSLLPGGPESGALGARGRVVKIWPRTRKSVSVASGFLGAANLALGPRHRIYVAELFANRISAVRVNDNVGVVEGTIEAPAPAAVEYRDEYLYVGYDVFNEKDGGSISTFYRPGAIGR